MELSEGRNLLNLIFYIDKNRLNVIMTLEETISASLNFSEDFRQGWC